VKHQTSADHTAASESDLMRKALYRTETLLAPTADSNQDADSSSPSDKCLFSTVYYAAQKGIANDTVNSLLNLQRFNAVDCKYVDLHSTTILSVQESIVAVLDNQMAERRCRSNFFGILIDESTDIAIHKSMVMYVRYVHNGKIMTDFVGNIRVSDGKAETLVCAVADKLGQLQIDCDKVVGLASDGASVMTGRKTGVGARLAAKCPGLIQVHCVAHRLNLSCTDALKQHPYLQLLREKVNSLFSHFSKSSAGCDKLKLFQEAIGEQQVRLKHAIEIRWLAMFDAVAAIHKSYGALVATLTDEVNKASGPTVKAQAIYLISLLTIIFQLRLHSFLMH
jgi:transposase-like protein